MDVTIHREFHRRLNKIHDGIYSPKRLGPGGTRNLWKKATPAKKAKLLGDLTRFTKKFEAEFGLEGLSQALEEGIKASDFL